MTIVAVLIAVVAAFIVFRLVAGVLKFGLIALIVVAALYFLANGGLG